MNHKFFCSWALPRISFSFLSASDPLVALIPIVMFFLKRRLGRET